MIEIVVSCIAAAAALGSSWIAHRTHREVRPRNSAGNTNGVSAGQVLYQLLDHVQSPVDSAHPRD